MPIFKAFWEDGMFAEYAAIEWHYAIHPPESRHENVTSIFCEGITGARRLSVSYSKHSNSLTLPLRTAYHAVNEHGLKPGDWFLSVGCGGPGQLAIAYVRAVGFKTVGLDISDKFHEAAGAYHSYNTLTHENYVEEIKVLTDGGADAAAVFNAALPAYESAKKVLHVTGVLVVIGLPSKLLAFGALEVMRSLYVTKSTSTGPLHKMPAAVEFTAKHKFSPKLSDRSWRSSTLWLTS